ncbi:MAG TPA: FmdB family transcriptional regulator [Bacteroidetes bacterium]|nr:FmdB family transcriptional regulator [Bacteroidota bacterium]
MPVFDYRCSDCGTTYDVYHKVKEITEDVICTHCGSPKHKKLMSAATVTMGSKSESPSCTGPSCESGGGCCGACEMN